MSKKRRKNSRIHVNFSDNWHWISWYKFPIKYAHRILLLKNFVCWIWFRKDFEVCWIFVLSFGLPTKFIECLFATLSIEYIHSSDRIRRMFCVSILLKPMFEYVQAEIISEWCNLAYITTSAKKKRHISSVREKKNQSQNRIKSNQHENEFIKRRFFFVEPFNRMLLPSWDMNINSTIFTNEAK